MTAVAPKPQLPSPLSELLDGGVVGGVIAWASTTKAMLVTFVPSALVAEMDDMRFSIWVGVPVMSPVAVLTLNPGGRLAAL